MNRFLSAFLGQAVVVLLLTGCVMPPPVDISVISAYQKSMEAQPVTQYPAADGQENLLRPAGRLDLPKLEPKMIKGKDGKEKKVIYLSLKNALIYALANNTDIRLSAFNAGLSREDVVKAAAAFDVIASAAGSYTNQDKQVVIPTLAGRSKSSQYQVGFRKRTTTGAQVAVTWGSSRVWSKAASTGSITVYEPTIGIELVQPLLRGGWSINTAELRLASLQEKDSQETLRATTEAIIANTHAAYWALIRTHRNREITTHLLDKTVETYNRVMERHKAGLDATKVQTKQTESAVTTRRAFLLTAITDIGNAQDALAFLIGYPTIFDDCDEVILTTKMEDKKLEINVKDQLQTAVRHNPQLARARLAIKAADISISVAENQMLPTLNVRSSVAWQAASRSRSSAYKTLGNADFATFSIGLELEYPLGNRAAQASLRASHMGRKQSILTLQQTADGVSKNVRGAARAIDFLYRRLQLQRATVAATTEELAALEDTEEIRAELTPEFLNLKLAAQQRLAEAASKEVSALELYNRAFVELRRSTGTILDMPGVKILLPPSNNASK